MPKIKTTRPDRARTRSTAPSGGRAVEQSRAQTPGRRKTIRKTVNKKASASKNSFATRKYFKVSEDWAILQAWTAGKGKQTTRNISDQVAKKIDHSSESVRDRIKRYLSKISTFDGN